MNYTDTFTEQAAAEEMGELGRGIKAARLEAKLQQKTIDLLSMRLDKVLEFIQLGEGGLDTWEKSDDD